VLEWSASWHAEQPVSEVIQISALTVSALIWQIIVFSSPEAEANTRNNLVTTEGTIGSMQIDTEGNYKHCGYFHMCNFD